MPASTPSYRRCVRAQRVRADRDMGRRRQEQRLRVAQERLFGTDGRGRSGLRHRDRDLPGNGVRLRHLPRIRDSHAGEQAGQARQQRGKEQQQTQAIRPNVMVSRQDARPRLGET